MKGKAEAGKKWVKRASCAGQAGVERLSRKAGVETVRWQKETKRGPSRSQEALACREVRSRLTAITFPPTKSSVFEWLVVDERRPTVETVHIVGANSPTVHGAQGRTPASSN